MKEFSGYEKIPKNLKNLGINDHDFRKLEKLQWVVTEKIHGANFSFVYENGQLKFAKRKEYLSWKDDFFGFQMVVQRIENNVLQLFERLSFDIKGAKYILYGELFGGEYPHPKVTSNKHVQAIQTGVYYTPEIEFCAFDIAIENNEKYYVSYEIAMTYFEKHDIFYARPLFVGKFNEALNFDTRIQSTIPEVFHLPKLENNLIEGIVVKPYNQKGIIENQIRPIIKLKNKEFDEEKKFHKAQKWMFTPKVSSNTEELAFLIDEIRSYITKNRLDSVVSKIGALDKNNESRLTAIETEFLHDAIADFNEDHDQVLEELNEVQKEWIKIRIKVDIKRVMISQF